MDHLPLVSILNHSSSRFKAKYNLFRILERENSGSLKSDGTIIRLLLGVIYQLNMSINLNSFLNLKEKNIHINKVQIIKNVCTVKSKLARPCCLHALSCFGGASTRLSLCIFAYSLLAHVCIMPNQSIITFRLA